MSAIAGKLRSVHDDDHERGCSGRFYQCSCGYDAEVLDALDRGASEIERLTRELAEARDLLAWLDLLGGLGLDRHARIRATLARLDAEEPKP